MDAGSGSCALPMRAGHMLVHDLIDLYMRQYAGRDLSRVQRLAWWAAKVGTIPLAELSDDEDHAALEGLTAEPCKFFAGKDAAGRAIHKSKGRPLSVATINRYAAALAAVITWAVKRRIAPKGFVHPCRTLHRQHEHNEKTRFLSDDERGRLMEVCRNSRWPKLYLLVLLALTSGARKGELLGLRWADIDLQRGVAFCGRTKNGDPKTLPLTAQVLAEITKFREGGNALLFRANSSPDKRYSLEGCWRIAL
jgi:integrase